MSAETPAPSAAEVGALAEVLLPFVPKVCTCQMFDSGPHRVKPHCLTRQVATNTAMSLFAAGYISPARHAAEVQAARVEAEECGYLAGYEAGLLAPASSWMKGRAEAFDEGVRQMSAAIQGGTEPVNPYRADGEAKA